MAPAADDPVRRGAGASGPISWPSEWDDALRRLEDLLLRLPEDRVLPPLAEVVEEAELPEGFLRQDDRARKLLLAAIAARPLSRVERVSPLRTEVELLTLEVEVLTDRMTRAHATGEEVAAAVERLGEVRRRFEELRKLL